MAVATACPHGFAPQACLICRTLAADPNAGRVPDVVRGRRGRKRGGLVTKLVGLAVVVVVALLLVSWITAAVGALIHLAELLAVALVSGSVGWRLGLRRGRRSAKRSA